MTQRSLHTDFKLENAFLNLAPNFFTKFVLDVSGLDSGRGLWSLRDRSGVGESGLFPEWVEASTEDWRLCLTASDKRLWRRGGGVGEEVGELIMDAERMICS